jgi:hypothetical protein
MQPRITKNVPHLIVQVVVALQRECGLVGLMSMTESHTPLRSEVPESDKWDLTPLYETPEAWEVDFQTLQSDYVRVADFRGRLGESPSVLAECLEFEKKIDLLVEQLNQYAALIVTGDSSDADALSREARLDSLLVKVGEAFSFISPEIQAITDGEFERFLDDKELSEWVVPLRKLRRRKPHTLTAGEERLMALGSAAVTGHRETFSQLTNVDMRFGSLKDGEGRERELTQSSFSSFLQQEDPTVRKAAFHQFYKEFSFNSYSKYGREFPHGEFYCVMPIKASPDWQTIEINIDDLKAVRADQRGMPSDWQTLDHLVLTHRLDVQVDGEKQTFTSNANRGHGRQLRNLQWVGGEYPQTILMNGGGLELSAAQYEQQFNSQIAVSIDLEEQIDGLKKAKH